MAATDNESRLELEGVPHHKLDIHVEDECLSIYEELWTKRSARVTLLVDYDERIIVVMDTSNGFWFLPGGGVEPNETIEEAAKREAIEEFGLKIEIQRIAEVFYITLVSRRAGRRLEIVPFIVIHAKSAGGRIKKEYAPNRKIVLVEKKDGKNLLRDLKIPKECECMKPYYYVSKEVVRLLATS
jgi:ADP-ribose pyrophosphatase YjhB (NUDIX family)